VSFQNQRTQGGGDMLRVGDRVVRITGQPGLQANPRRWTPGARCPQ